MAFMEVNFDKATEIPESLKWKIGDTPNSVSLKEDGLVFLSNGFRVYLLKKLVYL